VGFNLSPRRVRVGIHANDQNECYSPDSWIGFGSDDVTAVGNVSRADGDGDDNLPRRGMLLVRARDLSDLGARATCAQLELEGWVNLAGATVRLEGGPATCP
jgi:hypothetical protein